MRLDDFCVRIESALVVATEERNGATDCLNVNASPARRTVVDDEAWKTLQKFIPQPVHAGEVFDFRDAHAVWFIVLTEEVGQIRVEILSVTTEVQRLDMIRYDVQHVLEGVFIAVVEDFVFVGVAG